MARIRDIRLIPLAYHMPPGKAYGMARRLVASRGTSLVEVETEDGVIGIGEAWGPAKAAAGYFEVITTSSWAASCTTTATSGAGSPAACTIWACRTR